MIQELYLKKAVNIKRSYIKVINDVNSYEKVAKDLASSIEDRMEDLKLLMNKIEEGKISNVESAQMEFSKVLFNLETDMNEVNARIDSLNSSIDKLKLDELNLYKEIKNHYIDLSDEEIKKEVQNYLKKQNLS